MANGEDVWVSGWPGSRIQTRQTKFRWSFPASILSGTRTRLLEPFDHSDYSSSVWLQAINRILFYNQLVRWWCVLVASITVACANCFRLETRFTLQPHTARQTSYSAIFFFIILGSARFPSCLAERSSFSLNSCSATLSPHYFWVCSFCQLFMSFFSCFLWNCLLRKRLFEHVGIFASFLLRFFCVISWTSHNLPLTWYLVERSVTNLSSISLTLYY